jgi:hypothetical protein
MKFIQLLAFSANNFSIFGDEKHGKMDMTSSLYPHISYFVERTHDNYNAAVRFPLSYEL